MEPWNALVAFVAALPDWLSRNWSGVALFVGATVVWAVASSMWETRKF